MKTRLIFDHVPKTAGTSIASALALMFGEDGGLPDFANMHFRVINQAGSRRFLAGHMWFASNEKLAADWYYCTLLRDPVDRFLSQYWFYRELGRQHAAHADSRPHSDLQVQAASEHDLEHFLSLEDPAIRRAFTNFQAARYARRVNAHPETLSEESLLEAAIASLEDYDLVGVFEETQGFVDVIAQEFGFEPVVLPKLNVTRGRVQAHDMPARAIEMLADANKVDLRLHAWSRQRFADKKASHQGAQGPSRARAPKSAPGDVADAASTAMITFGTHEVEILSVRCVGEESGGSSIQSGESLRIVLDCQAKAILENVTLGLAVRDKTGTLVYGTNSRLLGCDLAVDRIGAFRKSLVLDARLGAGDYFVTVALHKGSSHMEGCYHWIENAAAFSVAATSGSRFAGLVDLGARFREP